MTPAEAKMNYVAQHFADRVAFAPGIERIEGQPLRAFYLRQARVPMIAMQAYFECGWTDSEIAAMSGIPEVDVMTARRFIAALL